MACERYLIAINELVDGTLGPLRRAELELHLESCPACAALLADLQEIARATNTLEDLTPPAHVWTQVVDQLRQEGRVAAGARSVFRRPSYTVLALAAALVLAVGASLLLLMPRQPAGTPQTTTQTAVATLTDPASNAAADDSVQSIAPGVTKQLDATETELVKLIEEAKKAGVAPETLVALQESLTEVTDAVERSRKALESDPQNAAARASFYDLLRQKIRFLQDTIALMSEMWQGDAAGAAQIVEGGKS